MSGGDVIALVALGVLLVYLWLGFYGVPAWVRWMRKRGEL